MLHETLLNQTIIITINKSKQKLCKYMSKWSWFGSKPYHYNYKYDYTYVCVCVFVYLGSL